MDMFVQGFQVDLVSFGDQGGYVGMFGMFFNFDVIDIGLFDFVKVQCFSDFVCGDIF